MRILPLSKVKTYSPAITFRGSLHWFIIRVQVRQALWLTTMKSQTPDFILHSISDTSYLIRGDIRMHYLGRRLNLLHLPGRLKGVPNYPQCHAFFSLRATCRGVLL